MLLSKLMTKTWQNRPLEELSHAMGLNAEDTLRYMNMLYAQLNYSAKPTASFTDHVAHLVEQVRLHACKQSMHVAACTPSSMHGVAHVQEHTPAAFVSTVTTCQGSLRSCEW